MADLKISALTASTTPLAGTEVLPIVQSSTTKQVSVANLTAGRSVSATNFIPSGSTVPTNGVYLPAANKVAISTNSTGSFAIDSTGSLLLGYIDGNFGAKHQIYFNPASTNGLLLAVSSGTFTYDYVYFQNSGGSKIGSISSNNSLVAYNVTSDYRIKTNVQPITGALAKVEQLNPVTYDWKPEFAEGGSQGFIAHELQAVVPECVTGEKDAVDENGKPKYQGIDVSYLVATLTAAIKEQQEMIESLKARLDAANL